MPVRIDGEWGRWMLKETLVDTNDFIAINLDSKVPIIGTGAPAELFLKKSAEHVNAHFVLPSNFEVANAVGAVSGSIMETREALVFTQQHGEKHTHVVKYLETREYFEEHEDACEYAEEKARELAKKAIMEAGATDPFVEMKIKTEGSFQRFTARAVGNPKISHHQEFQKGQKEEISELS
jgi:N-methylhydantoinase A/oxoprolinase/acetone carboxylase beta subunit